VNFVEGKGPRATSKRRTGIDARNLKSHEARALECAAIQDVLPACEALSADDNNQQKARLDRLVAMLTKLGQRGYAVREERGEYRVSRFDTDTDADSLANDTQADQLFNSQQVSHRLWRWTPQGSAVPACILVVMRGRSARQAPGHTKHSAVGQYVIHHAHLHLLCTEGCGAPVPG